MVLICSAPLDDVLGRPAAVGWDSISACMASAVSGVPSLALPEGWLSATTTASVRNARWAV